MDRIHPFIITRTFLEETAIELRIHWLSYIKKLISNGLEEAYLFSTPMESGLKIIYKCYRIDDTEFWSMIGAMLYFAQGSRSDIL